MDSIFHFFNTLQTSVRNIRPIVRNIRPIFVNFLGFDPFYRPKKVRNIINKGTYFFFRFYGPIFTNDNLDQVLLNTKARQKQLNLKKFKR